MAPKRSKKPSSALASGGTTTGVPPEPLRQTASTPADSPPPSAADSPTSSTADPPKLPPAAWKTGVQLEFMLSKFSLYLTHQNEGKLDRFWPPIFDYWQKTWPIDPPATAVKKHGGRENAIVVIRRETQVVRVTTNTILPPIINPPPIREFGRGFTTPLAQVQNLLPPPPPSSQTCDSIKARSGCLRQSKLTVLTRGTLVFVIS